MCKEPNVIAGQRWVIWWGTLLSLLLHSYIIVLALVLLLSIIFLLYYKSNISGLLYFETDRLVFVDYPIKPNVRWTLLAMVLNHSHKLSNLTTCAVSYLQYRMSAPNAGRQSPDPERQTGAQQQEHPSQPGSGKVREPFLPLTGMCLRDTMCNPEDQAITKKSVG